MHTSPYPFAVLIIFGICLHGPWEPGYSYPCIHYYNIVQVSDRLLCAGGVSWFLNISATHFCNDWFTLTVKDSHSWCLAVWTLLHWPLCWILLITGKRWNTSVAIQFKISQTFHFMYWSSLHNLQSYFLIYLLPELRMHLQAWQRNMDKVFTCHSIYLVPRIRAYPVHKLAWCLQHQQQHITGILNAFMVAFEM